MLNVIRFLERMGSEARWDKDTMSETELALAEAEVESPFRSAILNRDVTQLQTLLQQKPFVGYVMPVEEPCEEEEEGEDEDEPGEKDARHSVSYSLTSQS